MIYLVYGQDTEAKDKKIEELKKKFLPSADSHLFDFDSLSAFKLDPETFKKSLLNLPVIADKRLVLLRSAQKIDTHNQEILLQVVESKPRQLIVILECSENVSGKAFFEKIETLAQVFRFGEKEKANVFDMTNALEQRNLPAALKALHSLLDEGQRPLQIMGVVVWFWGKQKTRVSAQKFNEGLLALQEADWNIKRSKLLPSQAVEVALTKLSLLAGR